jgi:hypothetical protein
VPASRPTVLPPPPRRRVQAERPQQADSSSFSGTRHPPIRMSSAALPFLPWVVHVKHPGA